MISLHRDLEYDTTRHVTVDNGIDERLVRHARNIGGGRRPEVVVKKTNRSAF